MKKYLGKMGKKAAKMVKKYVTEKDFNNLLERLEWMEIHGNEYDRDDIYSAVDEWAFTAGLGDTPISFELMEEMADIHGTYYR